MRNRDGKEAGRTVERVFQERELIHMARYLRGDELFCCVEIGKVRLDLEAIGIAKSICAQSKVAVRIVYHLRSRFI